MHRDDPGLDPQLDPPRWSSLSLVLGWVIACAVLAAMLGATGMRGGQAWGIAYLVTAIGWMLNVMIGADDAVAEQKGRWSALWIFAGIAGLCIVAVVSAIVWPISALVVALARCWTAGWADP